MGKQYKKLIKRRRRTAYLARRKAALTSTKPTASKRASAPTKKATARKKAAPVEKPEPVAEKAKTEDVLGPDVAVEAPDTRNAATPAEQPTE